MSALAQVDWFDMVPLGGRMLKKRSPASKALRAATLTALLALVALALGGSLAADARGQNLTTELVANGFAQPLFACAPAGDFDRLFVLEQRGRIRIVDAFFTSCPTICPVISSQLARVHDKLWATGLHEEVRILSHTVDPANDTPERMLRYGARLGADADVWKFLTGPEEELYPLLQEGYLLTALPSDTAAGGFFHSDQVLLIDAEGHIRGTYDGTRTSEVDQMLDDLMVLMAQTRPADQP